MNRIVTIERNPTRRNSKKNLAKFPISQNIYMLVNGVHFAKQERGVNETN